MSLSIAKNTGVMTLASIGQKIVAFVYFTLIARMIGAEDTGQYFTALAFTTVFVVFVDLGFTNVLVREAAKVKEKMQTYFSTVLSLKLFLGLLSYLGLIVTIHTLGYEAELKHMIYLSGITMLFDSLHLSIYGVLRAIGNLKYEALSIVASQVLTLLLGSVFLFLGFPPIFLILAFTISSFVNVCYASIVSRKVFGIRLKLAYNKAIFYHLGKIAIPFALAAIFARVYSYIDTILLKQLAGNVAVGWYSIPYKITYAFQFVPLALVAALYPRFSEYFVDNKARLAFIFEQSMKYLMIVSFPIAIGIVVISKDIILTLYTAEYANSILPLKILIVSLIFSYLSFPIGAFLNACNKQATQTGIVAAVMVVNIVLNIFLIPKYGVAGAASAAFIGNALLTVWGYIIVPKITHISHGFLFQTMNRVLLAAGIMGAAVWYVNTLVHFTLAIAAGVIIYPILLFATKTVTKKQLMEAVELVRR